MYLLLSLSSHNSLKTKSVLIAETVSSDFMSELLRLSHREESLNKYDFKFVLLLRIWLNGFDTKSLKIVFFHQ